METPSSNRIVTRSQAGNKSSAPTSKEPRQRKSGQPLIDITNDSPIVGLTSGNLKTPLTSARKGRSTTSTKVTTMTPGSGEALLRGQVKNLLQMVEEESELQKLPCRPFVGMYRALVDSPVSLLAPANTPQVPGSEDQLGFELPSPIVQDPIFISQAVNGAYDNGKEEAKSPLTRSLMLEFLEKDDTDVSECHSTVTNLEETARESGSSKGKSVVGDDEDDSSIWSMQVNASAKDEDEDDEVVYKDEEEYNNNVCGDDDDVDELCCGMSGLRVGLPEFTGKHIRFVYNSDDDDEEVVEVEVRS